MTPEQQTIPNRQPPAGRLFPWRCAACGKKEVSRTSVPYRCEMKHDGRLYTVEVPDLRIPKCKACGEIVFDNEADDQLAAALREQVGLLDPRQIRANRESSVLSQRELADDLGIAFETVSRWETGAVTQSRAMDRLLRIYFAFPEVRASLRGVGEKVSFGKTFVEEADESRCPGSPSDVAETLLELVSSMAQESEAFRCLLYHRWRHLHASPFRGYFRTMLDTCAHVPDQAIVHLSAITGAWGRLVARLSSGLSTEPAAGLPRQRDRRMEEVSTLRRFAEDLEGLPDQDRLPLIQRLDAILQLWKQRVPRGEAENDRER